LEKIQVKYTYYNFTLTSEINFNDKLTKDIKALLYTFVLKFRESKLLSYFLLTINIGA